MEFNKPKKPEIFVPNKRIREMNHSSKASPFDMNSKMPFKPSKKKIFNSKSSRNNHHKLPRSPLTNGKYLFRI
jgi:hypothetical protein